MSPTTAKEPAIHTTHTHTHTLAWFTWVLPVSAALGYGFSLLSTVLLTIL